MLKMFRMLIHPSTGACDLFVELFHGSYCSGSMCVGVTLWFGWGGVVWYPYPGWGTSEITQQISRRLLRMDVLTSETCWSLNKEIIKQVTSSRSSLLNYQDDARSNKDKMHQCFKLFYFGMTLYMLRTVFPSIISSSRLYIQLSNRYCYLIPCKQTAVSTQADSSICLTNACCCMYSLVLLMMDGNAVRNM